MNAYIDPGTGSFLLQAILAVAVGLVCAIKQFRNKITALFGRLLWRGKKQSSH